jgi:hypothetical protein
LATTRALAAIALQTGQSLWNEALDAPVQAATDRAIERLRSDTDAEVFLAALGSEAGLPRLYFCRTFKDKRQAFRHMPGCRSMQTMHRSCRSQRRLAMPLRQPSQRRSGG